MRPQKKWILFFIAFSCLFSSFGQNVRVILDKDSITFGDTFELTLYAENINPTNYKILKWFRLPDTLSHLQTLKIGKIDSLRINGVSFYSQTIKMISFENGNWEFPALQLFLSGIDRKDTLLKTLPFSINILPINVDGIKDVHDINAIIRLPANYQYSYIWILGSFLFLTTLLIWYVLKIKRRKVIENNIQDYLKLALDQLDLLKLDTNSLDKQFSHQLYQIVKNYYAKALHTNVLVLTNNEWLIFLETTQIEPKVKEQFLVFLERLNTSRFSHLETRIDRMDLINSAKIILESVNLIKADD